MLRYRWQTALAFNVQEVDLISKELEDAVDQHPKFGSPGNCFLLFGCFLSWQLACFDALRPPSSLLHSLLLSASFKWPGALD